jgi:hypothetical protein
VQAAGRLRDDPAATAGAEARRHAASAAGRALVDAIAAADCLMAVVLTGAAFVSVDAITGRLTASVGCRIADAGAAFANDGLSAIIYARRAVACTRAGSRNGIRSTARAHVANLSRAARRRTTDGLSAVVDDVLVALASTCRGVVRRAAGAVRFAEIAGRCAVGGAAGPAKNRLFAVVGRLPAFLRAACRADRIRIAATCAARAARASFAAAAIFLVRAVVGRRAASSGAEIRGDRALAGVRPRITGAARAAIAARSCLSAIVLRASAMRVAKRGVGGARAGRRSADYAAFAGDLIRAGRAAVTQTAIVGRDRLCQRIEP